MQYIVVNLPFPTPSLLMQNCIATHESNGIDIITALILNDINPLGKKRMDLVLELKASRYFNNENCDYYKSKTNIYGQIGCANSQ